MRVRATLSLAAERGAALEGQPHLDLLTPQTCAHYPVPGSPELVVAARTRRRATAPGGGAWVTRRARALVGGGSVLKGTETMKTPRLLRRAREGPRVSGW